MKHLPSHIAVMAESPLAVQENGRAPEFIQLLPAGAHVEIQTADRRGPYRAVQPYSRLIAASFERADRLEIDINHATFMAAPQGARSDAVGWIVAMEERPTGLWGKVEWTAEGAALVEGKAYRAISPVFNLNPANPKEVISIANASLVNRPNLRGLAALNQESDVKTLLERLAELLGLDATSGEDDAIGAVKALKDKKPDPALQSQLAEIGQMFGVAGDGAVVVEAARKAAAASKGDAPAVVALQAELTAVTTRLNTVTETQAREKATAFVDGAIQKGHVGVKPLREHYIAMHMQDAARVEKELGALPVLGRGGSIAPTPPAPTGEVALNAEQLSAAKVLGLDPKAYAATLKAERTNEEAL